MKSATKWILFFAVQVNKCHISCANFSRIVTCNYNRIVIAFSQSINLSNSDSSDDGTNPSSGGCETSQTTRMFTCPEQSCTKTFIRYSALERHCEFGAHMRSLERITLQDRAKISYAKNLLRTVLFYPMKLSQRLSLLSNYGLGLHMK